MGGVGAYRETECGAYNRSVVVRRDVELDGD